MTQEEAFDILELRFPEAPSIVNDTLWRYMDFKKFVWLLERESLYFPRLDKLDDSFEGYTLKKYYELPIPSIEEFSREEKELLHTVVTSAFREHAYVSCWHSSEYESAAMWRLYSRGLDTIAIKTSGNSLLSCLDQRDSEKLKVGRVQYLDHESGFAKSDYPLFHFFMKRLEFEHENEVRIIYDSGSEVESKNSSSSSANRLEGISVNVNLSTLIEKVVVDPSAEKWFAELVCAVADRYGFGDRVIPSSLADPPEWSVF